MGTNIRFLHRMYVGLLHRALREAILTYMLPGINFYGWIFALASLMQISSNVAVSMYAVYHLDTYVSQPYHVFIGYLLILWGSAFFIVFANKYAPHTQHVGTFFVIVGGIVTIIILAAMPKRHATNHFVWSSFNENNATGWSGGVAFLLGVLNGAFTIGTPDSVTHMAEEMGHPRKDLPKAIMLQITLGFVCKCLTHLIERQTLVDLCDRCLLFRRRLVVRHHRHHRPPGRLQHLSVDQHLRSSNGRG